jgi:hypothetical protein
MSKITDERLESLLEAYHASEAGNAPDIDLDRKPVYAFPYKRQVISAASFILALAVGVAVFLLTRRPAVLTAPVPLPTSPATSVDGAQPLIPTEPPTSADSIRTASEPSSAPAISPSVYTAVVPDESYSQPEPYAADEPSAPRVTPTRSETDVTSASTQVQPTFQPETQPADPSDEPTDEPIVYPTYYDRELAETAMWVNYLSQQTVSGAVQKRLLTGEGRVYFRIYAFDGTPLGDEDLFSERNLAHTQDGVYDTVTASYWLGALEDDLAKIREGDMLTYRFFNEDGEVLCARLMIF